MATTMNETAQEEFARWVGGPPPSTSTDSKESLKTPECPFMTSKDTHGKNYQMFFNASSPACIQVGGEVGLWQKLTGRLLGTVENGTGSGVNPALDASLRYYKDAKFWGTFASVGMRQTNEAKEKWNWQTPPSAYLQVGHKFAMGDAQARFTITPSLGLQVDHTGSITPSFGLSMGGEY